MSFHQWLVKICTFAALLIVLPSNAQELRPSHEPPADRGLYVLGSLENEKIAPLPYVTGAQIRLQWKELETGEGKYDFQQLDAALKKFHDLGRKASIQVNGNQKPAWLFEKVAVMPNHMKESQVKDKEGVLQYWDPIFSEAYRKFILAFGEHVKASPYKNAVLGVRLNFNAVGTEKGGPRKEYDLSNFTPAPDGHIYNQPITEETWIAYKQMVVSAFIEAFRPDITLFVRNNVFSEDVLTPEQIGMLEKGEIGLFHTSSEIQPRDRGNEEKYEAFVRYCKMASAPAYAESWADAWGNHGGKKDARPFTPCQWNYWRLLCDLHCGVSYIAVYNNDLENSDDPEFRSAFEFAAKYAGYHLSPEQSPGAWVALREGDFLKGDYTFLMERNAQKSTDIAVNKQGPGEQRYGQWARQIEAGGKMALKLNPLFAQSLKDRASRIRIVYLDEGTNSFTVSWDQSGVAASKSIQKENSGKWQEAVIDVPQSAFTAGLEGNDIVLTVEGKTVIHMIEVQRGELKQ